jgi:ADP-ribosylglycohydrolase
LKLSKPQENNYKAKDFTPLFQSKVRYTDDTICTIATADSLLNKRPPAQNLKKWCEKYWNKGRWGQKFFMWLISPKLNSPYNSFGNGAAMRVSPCAWAGDTLEEALLFATQVTEITHNHPEGIKGAHAVTSAIYWARSGCSKQEIRKLITQNYQYDLTRTVDEIRLNNPHNESCQKTVPESITCALESQSFEDAIRNAISIGGDSDTIAAITGSISEAFYGIPKEIELKINALLPDEMLNTIQQFYSTYQISKNHK